MSIALLVNVSVLHLFLHLMLKREYSGGGNTFDHSVGGIKSRFEIYSLLHYDNTYLISYSRTLSLLL
jgi:hypothetical protein